jgi:hypothetical protein
VTGPTFSDEAAKGVRSSRNLIHQRFIRVALEIRLSLARPGSDPRKFTCREGVDVPSSHFIKLVL